MLLIEDIIEAYRTCRNNKRRSADSVNFETHYQMYLVDLKEKIESRSFQPTAYTFIATRPKPREVFACEMALRVIHHYLDIRLRPLIEDELSDRTFNNRKGYGQLECINQVISDVYEVSEGYTKDAWIVTIDLKGYFPNASQDVVYQQLSDLILRRYEGADKDELLYMLQVSVFSYPTHHCERRSPMTAWEDYPTDKSLFYKPDGIGGAIGHLIWQNAMNYYLNDYDHWLLDECGLHYTRFVDDQYFVTDNKECLLAMMPEIRRRLQSYGCTVHPRKMYCQHVTKGFKVLGYYVKMDRIYAGNRIVRHAHQRVKELNKRVTQSRIDEFIASLNSYCGIFKGVNGYAILRDLIDEVDPKWWKYVHFNPERLIVEANEGFTYRERIGRKYNLKFKENGNKRTNHNA